MRINEITLKENEDRRRIMREQSDQISKMGAETERLKKLLFQQRKIHEWSTTLLELDLAEIQAAWCDFDAIVAELKAENVKLRKKDEQVCALIAESSGVYGLHLNGDGASWIELMHSVHFSFWLDTYGDDFPFNKGEKK